MKECRHFWKQRRDNKGMKLLETIIKNFGKISGKSWKFTEGINVIYGENESGKTTLYTFIKSMFFGLERGRGRASLNDEFSQYEPWENPNFYAGILRFSCGNRKFRLERNFDKYSKSVNLICEDDVEELSVEKGDLQILLEGQTLDMFENTVSIGQLKAKTDQSLASRLQDYATNYYTTGDGEIHLEEALKYLNNKKKEIEKQFKEELIKVDRKREEVALESSYVWRDIHKIEQKLEAIDEEIKVKELQEKKKEEKPKWRVHPMEVLGILVCFMAIIIFILRPWNYLIVIVGALAEGIYIWNRMKEGGKNEEDIENENTIRKLRWERNHVFEELKEKQVQHSNLEEQLEELQEENEEHKDWKRKKEAIDLAAAKLVEVSKCMQKSLGQVLNEKTSEIIQQITGGKYKRLLIEDNLKISLLTEEKKIPIERVSRGTIEQIYFALRMASIEIMTEEDFPVILDETFAFYDEKRLQYTLKWLSENKKQVLLFTCQKREEELLEKMGISYTHHECR